MLLCNKSKSKAEPKKLPERWAEGKTNDFTVVKRKGRPKK